MSALSLINNKEEKGLLPGSYSNLFNKPLKNVYNRYAQLNGITLARKKRLPGQDLSRGIELFNSRYEPGIFRC